jgi:hypothetical protein
MVEKCWVCGSTNLGPIKEVAQVYGRTCNKCKAWNYDYNYTPDRDNYMSSDDLARYKEKGEGLRRDMESGKWNYKHGWGDK